MTRFDRKAMPTNLVLSYYGLKPLIKTPQRGGGSPFVKFKSHVKNNLKLNLYECTSRTWPKFINVFPRSDIITYIT